LTPLVWDSGIRMSEILLNNQKILIIKQSSLGDIIHTFPLVHALKRCFPGVTIDWVVRKGLDSIIRCDSAVNRVFPVDIPSTSEPGAARGVYYRAAKGMVLTLIELRRIFAKQPYDLVLDLHASFRSGLFMLCNPGGIRIGFSDAKEMNTMFQHKKITVPETKIHAQEKNFLFAPFLGCTVEKEDFFLETGEDDKRTSREFLQGEEKRLIYFNPVGRWESKAWPVERWALLADTLQLKNRVRVVLAGSGDDLLVLQEIEKRMKTVPLVSGGRLTLPQSAALIGVSSMYIGVDSGPMHMASLAGIPVVALFGPTDPVLVGPYNKPGRVLRNESLDCLVCRKRYCSELTCMETISVDDVYENALKLL